MEKTTPPKTRVLKAVSLVVKKTHVVFVEVQKASQPKHHLSASNIYRFFGICESNIPKAPWDVMGCQNHLF